MTKEEFLPIQAVFSRCVVENNSDNVGYGLIQKNPNSRSYSVRGLEKSVFTL